ncbi:hypothetical protein CFC21_043882 [Triticum aestivum]|uniref:Uncharacterized protein n=2 Tax=Triticum aestivum TaxID=4565 RepID=A0A9R1FPI4_WHEAT|nr:hypothetical protein CFC21_043882 [Triticum aestivum]
MAGLKPSADHSAFLDGNGPGDKLMAGFANSDTREAAPAASMHKKKGAPPANLAKDLFGNAYPSARDYIMRKQQLERIARAKARAEAEANSGASGDGNKVQHGAKLGGYYHNNESSRRQQLGMSGRFSSNGASKRQQRTMSVNKAAPAQGVEVPPSPEQAPPSPPSLYDINEFPALK